MFTFDNLTNDEVVHQRCVLISGSCVNQSWSEDSHVTIQVLDNSNNELSPESRWPLCKGYFKAMVLLNPGPNLIKVRVGEDQELSKELRLQYIPLLQYPPLHLAILVAKDSPLIIDSPPHKFGAVSGTHTSLHAAIAKFRATAYMWQALTAADMAANGLGRRSFRLEEEWTPDTVTRQYTLERKMQSTAKVHIIRSDKTVAQLRDIEIAQQNPNASRANDLHSIFTSALLQHGGPFESKARPVVAGLILDSTYSIEKKLILAHAALGAHNPEGLSLGIFGSHLTYAWPRFIDEVPDCLLDLTPPGDRVGNDNGECESMWEACSVGQGAFLHEVGHAFSAPHTTGIMARGYSPDWPKAFLSRTAKCVHANTDAIEPVTLETPNECRWDIRDQLRFLNLPHFRIPSDTVRSTKAPTICLTDEDEKMVIVVSCEAGIAQILFNGQAEPVPTVAAPMEEIRFPVLDLEQRFDMDQPVEVEVIAMNGQHRSVQLDKLLSSQSSIRVPGTSIRLFKKSVAAQGNNDNDDWSWAVMLKKRSGGQLVRATKIDVRVGCALDGAIVYYADGTSVPCGPRNSHGHDMGGHQAKKIAIPKGVQVEKLAVTRSDSSYLEGLRIWLSNGQARGALNKSQGEVEKLVPDENQVVIGFYGVSGSHGICKEFGIITAPKDVTIPDSVYDMPELQNPSNKRGKRRHNDDDSEGGDDDSTSEDEDEGYDNESDLEVIF